MDSMDVNKGIAAVLVAGIAFFITGLLGDNFVFDTPPSKPALDIKVAPAAGTEQGPTGPAPIAPLLAAANIQKGDQFVHQVCAACHSFNEGGAAIIGPNLYGIVGDPHDHMAGFAYSPALEKFKGKPWTYDALNKWLYDPQTYAPGTRMTYTGIKNGQMRADVIDYLHTLSKHPEPLPKVTPQEKAAAAGKPAAQQGPPEIDKLLASANIQKGQQFASQVCSVCHSFNKGGHPIVGPTLYGVVGEPHDHEQGFDYSPALEKYKGQPWTYEALNKWLTDPQTYAPGTRMTYAGIKNPQQRADVIDWLRTLSDHPEPLPSAKPEEKAAAGQPAEKTATNAPAGGAPTGQQAPAPGTAAPAGNHSATASASAPNSAPASSPNVIGPPGKDYNAAKQAPNAGSSAGGTGTTNAPPSAPGSGSK